MRKSFPGYYRPTTEEFKDLWNAATFVVDTNILLHLFRYGKETREQVLGALQSLKPRLWVPYWVGFEFQRGWREVDHDNREAYQKLTKKLQEAGDSVKSLFNDYERHQVIEVEKERAKIDEFISSLCNRLAEAAKQHPSQEEILEVLDEITSLIGDAVGERPTKAEIDAIVKEGELRYQEKTPPGYKDGPSKKGTDKYGDLLIWKAMQARSKETSSPIIFISDDAKEDWWMEFRGQKIGPRPELVDEMFEFSGQRFYMYRLKPFLEHAGNHFGKKVDAQVLKEIAEDDSIQQASRLRRLRARRASKIERDRSSGLWQYLAGMRSISDERAILERRLNEVRDALNSRDDAEMASEEARQRYPEVLRNRRSLLEELFALERRLDQLNDVYARTTRAAAQAQQALIDQEAFEEEEEEEELLPENSDDNQTASSSSRRGDWLQR